MKDFDLIILKAFFDTSELNELKNIYDYASKEYLENLLNNPFAYDNRKTDLIYKVKELKTFDNIVYCKSDFDFIIDSLMNYFS